MDPFEVNVSVFFFVNTRDSCVSIELKLLGLRWSSWNHRQSRWQHQIRSTLKELARAFIWQYLGNDAHKIYIQSVVGIRIAFHSIRNPTPTISAFLFYEQHFCSRWNFTIWFFFLVHFKWTNQIAVDRIKSLKVVSWKAI